MLRQLLFFICSLSPLFLFFFTQKTFSKEIRNVVQNGVKLEANTCDQTNLSKYVEPVNRIIQFLTSGDGKGQAYSRLAELTDKFGHRMVGSKALVKTIDYLLDTLSAEGLHNVHKEVVKDLPLWVRGNERATLVSPRKMALRILGLGGTVPTPSGGLCAQAVVVASFDELTQLGATVRGKFVVYNQPWKGYGQSVAYRSHGASRASHQGAIAVLIRSVTSESIYSPHTGALSYAKDATPIPAVSLTVEDAEMLHRLQRRNLSIKICLNVTSRTLGTVESHNTVAEIQGYEKPNEIVLIGGHLDSWDVGSGAMDDGGGVVISWQALSVLKALNLKPRRTIRAVFWTAEEQGYLGCWYYYANHKNKNEIFRFVYESDHGAFKPKGLAFYSNSSDTWCKMRKVAQLLAPINATTLLSTPDAGDVEPWRKLHLSGEGGTVTEVVFKGRNGVPAAILDDPEKYNYYFKYHHSQGDNVLVFDPQDLDYSSALTAIMAYVIADMEHPL